MNKLILFFLGFLFLIRIKKISVYSDVNFINLYQVCSFVKNNKNFSIFYDKVIKPKLEYKIYD